MRWAQMIQKEKEPIGIYVPITVRIPISHVMLN